MRRAQGVACVAVAGLLMGGCDPKVLAPKDEFPITITVNCTPAKFTVDVSPFVATIPYGSVVKWTLVSNDQNATIDIDKEGGWLSGWAFDHKLPYKVKPNQPVGSGNMKADAKPKYRYNIEGTCSYSTAEEPMEYEIDPDIIIIR